MRENAIAFADIQDSEGTNVAFSVTGISGHNIDHTARAGQVTLNISGYDKDKVLEYDTVVDLELPLARAFAAAILHMADWVEQQDRKNRAKE
jgi:nicotinamide mononucleotide (NMN) deamidase PncC